MGLSVERVLTSSSNGSMPLNKMAAVSYFFQDLTFHANCLLMLTNAGLWHYQILSLVDRHVNGPNSPVQPRFTCLKIGIFLLSHLLVAGCDIGVRFSVCLSVRPSVCQHLCRRSTFMSKLVF